MRNLWIFLSRYNAFFFFLIFFTFGIFLTLTRNDYQHSVTVNSTNEVVGAAYTRLNVLKRYLSLGRVNDSLNNENARLKTLLLTYQNPDSTKVFTKKDSLWEAQYECMSAKVIKNSITLRNNYITINKGRADGIKIGMAVISVGKGGVVGIVNDVSEHLARIQSLLHKDSRISVALKKNNVLGSLVWGDGNFDITRAIVKEIPNQVKVSLNDTIITSGAGFFPKGVLVGRVVNTSVATGDNFMSLQINLINDFSNLQYVYVVKDKLAAEQTALETKKKGEQ